MAGTLTYGMPPGFPQVQWLSVSSGLLICFCHIIVALLMPPLKILYVTAFTYIFGIITQNL